MQKSQLIPFGLTEKESEVYLALLNLGSANLYNVAQKTGINRITLPDVLDSLLSKKLIRVSIIGKRKFFVPEAPEVIKQLLKDKVTSFDSLLPQLLMEMNKGSVKPKMEYYEGVEGIKKVFRDSLSTKDKMMLGFSGIGALTSKSKTLLNFWEKEYIPKRKKIDFNVKLIIPDDEMGKYFKKMDKTHLRESRLLPASQYNFECEIHTYDDITAFISYTAGEEFALKIKSAPITNTLQMIWKIVWNQGY